MRKLFAMLIVITMMLSIGIPASVSAATVANLRQTDDSESSVTFEWDAVLGASKYLIEISEDKDSGYITDQQALYATKRTIYNLSAGKTYYVKVTAYSGSDLDTSSTSEPVAVVTSPKNPENFRQTNATTSSVTFKWDAVYGATSYKVYERVNNQDYLLGTTKKAAYKLKGLSNRTSFANNFYLRAIRTVNGYNAGENRAYYNCSKISSYNVNLVPKKAPKPKITTCYDSIGVIYITTPGLAFQKGYETAVYKANSKSVYTTTTGSRISGLQKNQFYKMRTRAYTVIGGKKSNLYGKWSDYTYFTIGCKTVNIKAQTNALSVSWSKIKGGKVYYDIKVSKTKDSGLKLFKKNYTGSSIKVTKYGKSKLSRRTKYYVYIQPKIKVGKKLYTAPYYNWISTSTL